MRRCSFLVSLVLIACAGPAFSQGATTGQVWPPAPPKRILNISGVYPHLAVFSGYGECGIGAVVPWADRLWFITYPPHFPDGSDDKLYTVDANLRLEARPESVGGTHANRMIHDESNQLILGPYIVDAQGRVRAISPKVLRARLTATTRHLTDPTHRIFFVGMERELYEVDVNTLEVRRMYAENKGPFPGTHGKGAAVAQGRLIVANNGESGWDIRKDPGFNGPAGCLVETDGRDWSRPWTVVERANFCEVTGPGGIHGDPPADQRIWATGWDKRSVILKLLDAGQWHTYRLPKASYTHDALHGWYTEWPRIREVTDGRWLMHMHGMFYDFPKTFSAGNTAGLRPISTYLKMPVDYCAFQGRIVMARDETSVMQNPLAGQSHSNLWFGTFADLERYGAPAGWGGPWVNDTVKASQPSDPFLIAGFTRGTLFLANSGKVPVKITIETDRDGRGQWQKAAVSLGETTLKPESTAWVVITQDLGGQWMRLSADRDATGITAFFHLSNPPHPRDASIFKGLADISSHAPMCDGIIKPADRDARNLLFAANIIDASGAAKSSEFSLVDGDLEYTRSDDAGRQQVLRTRYGIAKPDFTVDAASVIVSENGRRWRLPKTDPAYDAAFATGWPRGRREVITERDLFNAHGTFYEVPRASSGGFQRIRPICTHRKHISDFCSWRGMLVLAGVSADAQPDGHVFRSAGSPAALWFGEIDDLWRLGAPVGTGGPWKETSVTAGTPSDPYLMAGYDRKILLLSHSADIDVTFTVQLDFMADGTWTEYRKFKVAPGQTLRHDFPADLSAHWVRLITDKDTKATALFNYSAASRMP